MNLYLIITSIKSFCIHLVFKNLYFIKFNLLYLYLISLNIQLLNFLMLLLIFSIGIQNIKQIYKYVYIIIYYLFSILNIINKNISIYINISLPHTLFIGFNSIHPILYYFSFISFVIYFQKNIFYYYYIIYIRLFIYILLVALILGMYWGAINSSWSFFWVNDYIELIILFLILFSLYKLHSYKFEWYNIIVSFCLLLLFIGLIRLGFLKTRHSFFLIIQISSYAYYLGLIISIYVLVLYNNFLIIILWYCILMNIKIYTYINYLFCIIFIYSYILINSYINNYKKYQIGHFIFFIILFTWIININNNTIYYYLYKNILYNSNIYISYNNFYFFKKLIFFSIDSNKWYLLVICYMNIISLYNSKNFAITLYTSIISYGYSFIFILWIISICKTIF